MIEIDTIGEVKTAIVSNCKRLNGNELPLDIESLWLTPESNDFVLENSVRLDQLKVLYIANCNQPLLELVDKSSVMRLESLLVAQAPSCLTDVEILAELPKLKSLKIREQSVNSESVDWLCQQTQLTSLALTDTDVDDSVIARLGCKETLRRLDLFRSEVSFDSVQLYGALFPSNRSLDIQGTGVSGSSVEIIGRMFPNLERLLAEETNLSVADVGEIASWEKLKVLSTGHPDIDFDHHGDPFWDL